MEELKKLFGTKLLSYILACDSIELETPVSSWPEVRQHTLEQLETLRNGMSNQDSIQQKMSLSSIILSHLDSYNTSLANVWRINCGGEVYQVAESGDPCADILQAYARDIYPSYLIPPRDDGFAHLGGPTAEIYQHPLHASFCRAVLDDDDLSRLFPGHDTSNLDDGNKIFEIASYLQFSSGNGFTYQLVMLASQLLSAAHQRQIMHGDNDQQSFVRSAMAALSDARCLARGESIMTPAIAGLSGVVLGAESVTLGENVLRRVESDDFVLLPTNSNITSILVMGLQFKLLKTSKWKMGEEMTFNNAHVYQQDYESWYKSIRDSVNLVRFALLCSSDHSTYITARQEGLAVLNPLGYGYRTYEMVRNFPGIHNDLSGDQRRATFDWHGRLTAEEGTMDIAIRRILSAVSERLDPVDGLIDAVMAWENMFSGTPETGVRVCGSLANILEPDNSQARYSLFKELKRIYNMRSRLVHGDSDEPSMQSVFKARDRAIEIAVSAARKVYQIEGFAGKKSAERSEALLLWTVRGQSQVGEQC